MSASQDNARFGLIIVGDEILSGRRQDKHMSKVIELLSARGLQLSWVEVLSDDRALSAALRRAISCLVVAGSAPRPMTTLVRRLPPR